ncbi:MAG: DinB family protein [Aggregatilineales bacterium]
MSERIQRHINEITAAREELFAVLEQVGERGDEQLYSDGAAWTIRQLAIHLLMADKGHNGMLMTIAAGKELIPEDYDLERYNKRSVEKNANMSMANIITALKASRAELLDWLNSINDATLDKRGRHATLRVLSLSEILDIVAWHDGTHGKDIQAHLESA